MDINDFEERLRWLLRRRRITQTDLAKKLGISLGRLNNYASGRSSPNMELLSKIATELHTTIDYLVGRIGNPEDIWSLSYLNVDLSANPVNPDKKTVSFSIPLYKGASVFDDTPPWADVPIRWINFDIMSDEKQPVDNSYAIEAIGNYMSPYVMEGDILIVGGGNIPPENIKCSTRDIYSFKRSEKDSVGLAFGCAFQSEGIITILPASPDSSNKVMSFPKGEFYPITGKVITIFRRLY